MIVFGGTLNGDTSNSSFNDGARYNPSNNAWTALPLAGAPGTRSQHTAVWTGSEMIVFGGVRGLINNLGDGARYRPASDTWTTVSTAGAPTASRGITAIWTGSEMILGGSNSAPGFRYNPTSDLWIALPTAGAPSSRAYSTAVWTGTDMLVWGGYDGFNKIYLGDTYSYTPGRLMYLYQRP